MTEESTSTSQQDDMATTAAEKSNPKKRLFEDDDEDDNDAATKAPEPDLSFKIDKEFARKYEHNKKREEKQKCSWPIWLKRHPFRLTPICSRG